MSHYTNAVILACYRYRFNMAMTEATQQYQIDRTVSWLETKGFVKLWPEPVKGWDGTWDPEL